jgi:hypothetical protein
VSEGTYFRQQAARARRLAKAINQPEVIAALEKIAAEFDQKAEAAEAAASEKPREKKKND